MLSQTHIHSFGSIEQLDEVTHSLGWQTEYRQLKPGAFSSTFTTLEGAQWFLMEEHTCPSVEVQAPAPAGMYALALIEGGTAVLNGQRVSPDHLFVLGPDSECRVTLPTGIMVSQMGIASEVFEDVHHSVAPELPISRLVASSIANTPGRLANLRETLRAALYTPAHHEYFREEAVTSILTSLITVAADHGKLPFGRSLHRAAARKVLERSREYIEARLNRKIRVDSMCRYAGTNLRSLQRTFAREMGMTPQQYVKSRRLNAVRQSLLQSDREEGLSVTIVAMNHGFVHLGRFAADYRRLFGESPRTTLQKR